MPIESDGGGVSERLSPSATAVLAGITMVAFASNSLLCRGALADGATDPATFTLIRLGSAAAVLPALMTREEVRSSGSWPSGLALFAYAALFSFAYVRIPAGLGALVLFGAVQLTMLAWAVKEGGGPRGSQWLGVAVAVGGLGILTAPGSQGADLLGILLMAGSGLAWGVYSLRGRRETEPALATAANFTRAAVPALVTFAVVLIVDHPRASTSGILLAILSGVLASGFGYILWYAVLPSLGATRAAVTQLAAPALAALGGVLLLGEVLTPRLVLAAAAILGGIALVTTRRRPRRSLSSGDVGED